MSSSFTSFIFKQKVKGILPDGIQTAKKKNLYVGYNYSIYKKSWTLDMLSNKTIAVNIKMKISSCLYFVPVNAFFFSFILNAHLNNAYLSTQSYPEKVTGEGMLGNLLYCWLLSFSYLT